MKRKEEIKAFLLNNLPCNVEFLNYGKIVQVTLHSREDIEKVKKQVAEWKGEHKWKKQFIVISNRGNPFMFYHVSCMLIINLWFVTAYLRENRTYITKLLSSNPNDHL